MKRKILSSAMALLLVMTLLPVTAGALTPDSDVSITIDDGVGTAVPGTTQTYTIVVTNNGANSESGVGIYCTLPAETQNDFDSTQNWTVASTSGGANITGGNSGIVLAWTPPETSYMTSADMPSGSSVTLILTVKIRSSATGSFNVIASITSDFATATDTDTLTPQADLAVAIDDSKSSFAPGDSTVYMVTVTNAGPSKVTGANLSCPLPAGATGGIWGPESYAESGYASPSSGEGALSSSVDLDAGGSYHFWFRVDTSPDATGTFSATANFTAPSGVADTDLSNNSATDTDGLASEADLDVWLAFGDQTGNAANEVTFDVYIRNQGPSTATGITVSASLPPGVTLVHAAPDSGTTYDPDTGDWAVGTLGAYSSTYLELKAAADFSAPKTMTASVLDADLPDPDMSNNSDSLVITDKADIAVSAGVDHPAPDVGDTVTITVALTNNGPNDAAYICVVAPLPSGLTYVNDTPSAGYYDPDYGWEVDSLDSGDSQILTIQATVSSSTPQSFSAQAEASVPDPDMSNNFATVTVIPSPAFVPVTGITGVPAKAAAGTPLTLSGTAGPANATNRAITWSVLNARTTGATISGNTLYTAAAGTVTVRATITNGLTKSSDYTQDFEITVNTASAAPNITTTILPDGTVGTAYSQTLSATGDTPITWSLSGGNLPNGLSLSGNTISGTPNAAGTFSFTLKAENTAGNATQALSIAVTIPNVIQNDAHTVIFDLTDAGLPDGVTSVSVGSNTVPSSGAGSESYTAVQGLINGNQGLVLYDLKLLDQNGNPITGFTGTIKVKIKIPDGLSGNLHVYWYDPATGALTDMNATVEDGCLVFETNHFSLYAMAQLAAAEPTPTPTAGPAAGNPDIPGLPDSFIMYTGGRVTWMPGIAGGVWHFDPAFFKVASDSTPTFTALRAGTTTVTYTVGWASKTISVTIRESRLPQTGQDGTWIWVLSAAACAALAAGILIGKKRLRIEK